MGKYKPRRKPRPKQGILAPPTVPKSKWETLEEVYKRLRSERWARQIAQGET